MDISNIEKITLFALTVFTIITMVWSIKIKLFEDEANNIHTQKNVLKKGNTCSNFNLVSSR